MRHTPNQVSLVMVDGIISPVIADVSAQPALVPAARTLFTEYQQDIGVDLCFQGFPRELRELPGDYAPPRGCLLVALGGSEPLGCVALRPLADGAAEIKRLYVRPPARGQGLGRRLAAETIDRARALGYARLRLDTLDTMTPAIALYRSLGFVERSPYVENPLPGPLFFELAL
jgi:putative acetyltransferase